MQHLTYLKKYFWKYRVRFFVGMLFIVSSNYFAVLAPQITGYIVNLVQQRLPGAKPPITPLRDDPVVEWFIHITAPLKAGFGSLIA